MENDYGSTSYNPRAEEDAYAKKPVAANPDGPHKFIEVSEQNRTYFYPHPKIKDAIIPITIDGVKSIHVSASGTHRINLVNGKKRMMPSGWLSIEFDAPHWTF